MTAVWVLLATAVVVAAVGGALRWRSGRIRPASGPGIGPADRSASGPASRPSGPGSGLLAELTGPADTGVTLLQLSTTFCAPCRHTRVLLTDLAARTPGLRHVDVDLTSRPELAGPLRVRSTPTTIAVDAGGRELLRFVGVPRRDALLVALQPHLTA